MQQYRNYPQSTQRSPHAAGRRGPGPMIAPPHAQTGPTAQQIAIQDAARREFAKRRSKKPTDKNMPEGIEEIAIGDGTQRYKELRDVERRLDATMMRKRLDMQESITRNMSRYRTMRIWISNIAENQPWQQTGMDPDAFDFSSDTQATYRVKIEGRLLPDDEDAEDDQQNGAGNEKDPDAMEQDGADAAKKAKESPAQQGQRTKLSHFFRSITIDFDRSRAALQPDGFTQIEWKKPASPNDPSVTSPEADFDSLQFERKGDENMNVTIKLVRDDNPERYRLSPQLAELLDTDEDDRAGIMMGLWSYVKAMNLHDEEDSRRIQCDDRLKAIFNTDTLFFPYLPSAIHQHLQPVPPLELSYTIRVDKSYIAPDDGTPASQPTIYDVQVPLEDPLRMQILATQRSPTFTAQLAAIAHLDENIAYTMAAINEGKAKHAFYTNFSKDPAGFMRRWLSSQRRDLEVILGDTNKGVGETLNGDEWRYGGEDGPWGGQVAKETVTLWLARNAKTH